MNADERGSTPIEYEELRFFLSAFIGGQFAFSAA
jgi:hypothetical protein